jgi:arylformamidase
MFLAEGILKSISIVCMVFEEVYELLLNNVTFFAGLNLSDVHEGGYTFLGLPLLLDMDGAPARVILIKE